jgi:hypothetical protein
MRKTARTSLEVLSFYIEPLEQAVPAALAA